MSKARVVEAYTGPSSGGSNERPSEVSTGSPASSGTRAVMAASVMPAPRIVHGRRRLNPRTSVMPPAR